MGTIKDDSKENKPIIFKDSYEVSGSKLSYGMSYIKDNSVVVYEKNYRSILTYAYILGTNRKDRTGVGSRSTFNEQLKWDLSDGFFPLLTGRKMFEKTFKTEFDWFMAGETNIKRFQDAGVKIWDAWADDEGHLGPVYGYQMLNFNNQQINQLEAVIYSLKHNPDSRRHIISLWNPVQLEEMALPPCYLYFQFYVQHTDYGDFLNMFVVQRSGDLFLGIPYDVALFSQLLLYIAEEVGMIAKEVNLQIIDAHIYNNQETAILEYMEQPILNPPTYNYYNKTLKIENYKHGPVISAPVAV